MAAICFLLLSLSSSLAIFFSFFILSPSVENWPACSHYYSFPTVMLWYLSHWRIGSARHFFAREDVGIPADISPPGDTSWARASTSFFPEDLWNLPTPCLLIAISCSFPHISLLLGSRRREEKWTSSGAGRKQKESRSWVQEIWVFRPGSYHATLLQNGHVCRMRDFHPVLQFLLALTFSDALQCSEHDAVFARQHRKA